VSTRAVGSIAVALTLLVAAMLGAVAFAVVTIALAGLVLLDLSGALAQAGARPVVLAAAVPGLALPIVVAATDLDGWTSIADYFALMLLLAFALVIVFGRREGVTAAVGATALTALVAGLGGVGLLLLRALPDGFRWVAGVAVLTVAAELGVPAARGVAVLQARRRRADDERPPREEPGPHPGVGLALAGVFTAAGAALLAWLWVPPFGVRSIAAVAATVFVARVLADELGGALHAEARDRGQAAVAGAMILLVAPVVYVVARSAVV
jgi:hypothetical protein